MATAATHPALQAARDCNALRHAVRRLADEAATPDAMPDRVGLALAADTLDAVAGALDRNWWVIRPLLDAD